MTDSEHAALSAQLARAIGWPWVVTDRQTVVWSKCDSVRAFDYLAPDVYGPLIEFLLLEGVNVWNPDGIPTAWEWSEPIGEWGKAESLPEAVARAVIAISRDLQD